MSELSYLEKLLDGVEVEWKSLGEIATKIYSGGTPDTKRIEYWENGTIPWMSSGEVNLKNIERTEKYITEAGLNNSSAKLVPRNSVVIALAGQGKTRGKVARIRIALATNQSLAALTFDEKKFSSDYVFHFLETQYESLRQISSGNSGRGGLNLQMISAYKIPIPCPGNPEKSLAIQSEIVRILDKFTALTAELTAELNMRKKQYNYYRDQLLSFKEGEVKWKTLGEITEINTGQKPSEILDKAATFDYINAGTSRSGYTTMSNCDGDTVTTPSRGQGGIGFVGYQKTPFWLGPLCYKIKSLNNEILINKFLFYTLQSRNRILLSLKKEGGVPAVNKIDLAKLIIPLPSLDEQKRIVSLLDKFDTLTNSITEGLPREIELRQKQYEYYRDLLFSFPKPETVSN
ncbi:restriction endonuclease subunit S [Escherichia coli]|nr:restriction endonuclease subunit S [Escherichia coli]EFL2368094.1 restriction endonuclease subunit S [Escherichia coli]EFN8437114.1 restriction endonuclease subunit S [Escherichia coli]HAH9487031.1 restriction endonuclease subunit S [Escherichia coli]HAX4076926.1 restriction endonuclease subunit S [Escherichia coli]